MQTETTAVHFNLQPRQNFFTAFKITTQCSVKRLEKKSLWISSEIISLSCKKTSLCKLAVRNQGNEKRRLRYKQCCNSLKYLVKQSHCSYFIKLTRNINLNPKHFWLFVNNKRSSCVVHSFSIIPLFLTHRPFAIFLTVIFSLISAHLMNPWAFLKCPRRSLEGWDNPTGFAPLSGIFTSPDKIYKNLCTFHNS